MGLRPLFLLLLGCSVTDASILDRLRPDGAMDRGVQPDEGVDAGVDEGHDALVVEEQDAVDRCGDPDTLVINRTAVGLTIDTRVLNPTVDVSAACNIATAGADGFIGLDVRAGQVWHFHLSVMGRADANPSLYLLPDTCNVRFCEQVADNCSTTADEHFAFVPERDGRWYIVVDDGVSGGAEYNLDSFMTVCDRQETEHGENCDGRDGVPDENCSADCRTILNADNTSESFPNQNFVEANELDLSGGPLTITGDVGDVDGACTYPDVYTVLADEGEHVRVSADGCTAREDADYELRLLAADGSLLQSGVRNNLGCPEIDRAVVSGRYFIEVVSPPRFATYRLRFDVGAP